MMVTDSPALEGTVVGARYRVERLLGQGGMGSVWAARHLTLNKTVAIKFIHPRLATSEEVLRRFDNEAKAAARIQSRHAVSVFDHGVTDTGQPYIVMEYLEGESLERKIRRTGRLPFLEVASIIAQAAEALSAAHEQGIVHRDLKPDNVFLAREREAGEHGYVVKLLDFGIAKMMEEDGAAVAVTQAGVVLGTPQYMSPEALTSSAPVTRASDIWSLGACAFTAAVGRVPFEGDAIGDVVLKVCAAPLPVPSSFVHELPRGFDAWFAKACSRTISARFPSAERAARAISDLTAWERESRESSVYELCGSGSAERSSGFSEPPSVSRRGLVLAGGLVGASSMLAALGYYVFTRTKAADAEAAASVASARAIIEAENERRLREADSAFWARHADAGPPAPESASSSTKRKKAPRAP